MILTWMGTASLLLKSGSTVLAFDPFPGLPLGKSVTDPDDVAAFRAAGAVLVTHGHFDHIMAIPSLYAAQTCPVYATAAPRETLARRGFPETRLHPVAPGSTLHVGPFAITAYPGRHCHFDGPLLAQTALRRRTFAHLPRMVRLLYCLASYPEKGEILFYEVTDGEKRVQIMGSLGLDDDTDYPRGADALVLPFQGRSDLTDCAVPLVERLNPQSVLLDHYDDAFPPMTAPVDTAAMESALRCRGIPCRPLQKYETLLL